MMNDARTKIGIFPVTTEDVKFFWNPDKHGNIENLGESQILYDQEFHYERMVTANDFCKKHA